MLETCRHCNVRVLYTSDYCPNCHRSRTDGSMAPEFLPALPLPALASRVARLLAFAIDLGLIVVVVAIVYLTAPHATEVQGYVALGGVLFCGAVAQCYLLATTGQTIGKRILRIRIVSLASGETPSFSRVVIRRYFLPLILWFLGFGLLLDALFIFGKERRCIHDILAGTKVIAASTAPGE
jgi:uncharacterized RDD family membrane protein YckC